MADNPRAYGTPPFTIAVIHGGPGAGGEMAPVARALSAHFGVLEPIQTALTLDGQVEELHQALEAHAELPLVLVGYSWGAWLSWITTARYPALVRKLILVSSGPFEQQYGDLLAETRRQRLSPQENQEFADALNALSDPAAGEKDAWLARLGALAAKTNNFMRCLPRRTMRQPTLTGIPSTRFGKRQPKCAAAENCWR